MKNDEYFFLGCKLFGVYCLIMGLPYLLGAIPVFVSSPDYGPEFERILLTTKLTTLLIPLVYILGGFYLIRDARLLYRFAYSGKIEADLDLEGKLTVFTKMLGLFLVVTYFPDLLKTISNFVVSTVAPRYYDMFSQKQFTYLNVASSFGTMGFGIYLLKSGKIFIRMCLGGNTLPD
jgi:hypothetical protein